jgi:hypothetical protein
MPLDRGGISGDSTDLLSTNGALRAVKRAEEGNESHVGLTWHRTSHVPFALHTRTSLLPTALASVSFEFYKFEFDFAL